MVVLLAVLGIAVVSVVLSVVEAVMLMWLMSKHRWARRRTPRRVLRTQARARGVLPDSAIIVGSAMVNTIRH